jgi:hypothetical protein
MVYFFCIHTAGVTVTLTLAKSSVLEFEAQRRPRWLTASNATSNIEGCVTHFIVGSTEFFDVEGEAQQRRRSNYFIYKRENEAQNLD